MDNVTAPKRGLASVARASHHCLDRQGVIGIMFRTDRFRHFTLGAIGALLAAVPALAAPTSGVRWFTLATVGGTPIGYATRETRQDADGRTVVESEDLFLADEEGGAIHQTSRTERREDGDGRQLSLGDETRSAGVWTRNTARLSAGEAEIEHRTPHDRLPVRVALATGVRFDVGERLLPGWDPAARPLLAVDNLNLDAMQVDQVTFELDPGGSAPGGGLAVLRKRYVGGRLVGLTALTLGADRRIVAATQPMFGTATTLRETDQATALAASAVPRAAGRDVEVALPHPGLGPGRAHPLSVRLRQRPGVRAAADRRAGGQR